MKTETMNIHQALATLKVLDKKITDAIESTTFAAVKVNSNDKIAGLPVNTFIEQNKAKMASIKDMLARRKAIRNAVSLSNATTEVTVGGETYTIAECIEMKQRGLGAYRVLFDAMTKEYNAAKKNVTTWNEKELLSRADQYVGALFSGKDKLSSEEARQTREIYINANKYELILPTDLETEINSVGGFIETFLSEIDAAISVSNATTIIEVNY